MNINQERNNKDPTQVIYLISSNLTNKDVKH